ncbi:MAG: J domain-containing protein [Deltaproteobacteria bacterium]|nr:J domain-containing protein [Deltaproteobacteria bacterium]
MADDYYTILGIDQRASQDDIKKAYRKLALKYHPDRNPGNKQAEETFKKINEAYAVLSDLEKRKKFDTFGSKAFSQQFSQEDIFRNFDFNEILREFGFRDQKSNGFFKSFGSRSQQQFQRREGDFFTSYFGDAGQQRPRRQPQKGQDLDYSLTITLEEAYEGIEKNISLRRGQAQDTLKVKIPRGITEGKRLRLSGKGMPGVNGGPPGDIFITICVAPHGQFTRNGDDIIIQKTITFTEAALGTSIEATTLGGERKRLKVPQGTQNNTKLRMKGLGMPHMGRSGRGDAYVLITVDIPRNLTERQKELIYGLAKEGL